MADETRVWIAQCLCGPNRHAILAAAGEARDEAEARDAILWVVREGVAALVPTSINPWCGICGAEQSGWRYVVGRTRHRTLAEAAPDLAETAAANIDAALRFGTHGPQRPRMN